MVCTGRETVQWLQSYALRCHARFMQCQIYAASWAGLLWPCRESNLDAAVSRRDRGLYLATFATGMENQFSIQKWFNSNNLFL